MMSPINRHPDSPFNWIAACLYRSLSRVSSTALTGIAAFSVAVSASAQAPVVKPGPRNSPQPAVADTPSLSSALDAELFYQLLLGELNVRGGEPGAGFSLILDAARKTQDPRLYERAVRVALQSRSGEPALQAARAWKQAIPGSRDANRYILQILVGLNRIGETAEPLKSEVAGAATLDRNTTIAAIPGYFARSSDRKQAAAVVEQALADYLNHTQHGAAAWSTVGRMRIDSGDSAGAMDAARRAQALDASAEGPARLGLMLMGSKTPLAEQIVRKHLEGKAGVEVRMEYARALLDAQRYSEALAQLQTVSADKPDHPQAWLIRGTLEVQDKQWDVAEQSLKRHLALTPDAAGRTAETNRGLAQAYLSLAQIAEHRKDFAQAESWLGRIDNADDMIVAQSRRAAILARQGKLEEGRKLIRGLPEKTPADARQKILAEVQLLRDNKQYKTAYALVTDQTRANPGDYELMYDQAMLAEKTGQLDEMERILRAVIAAKPDYQHAYNALGYSLAERKIRLPEARQLILKALELAPDDPFITDSLGWLEFQSGNIPEALRILQTAYKIRPDAEIAAHLGEVLWVSGQRDQALIIWREAAALNADSETLVETLKRLRVKP